MAILSACTELTFYIRGGVKRVPLPAGLRPLKKRSAWPPGNRNIPALIEMLRQELTTTTRNRVFWNYTHMVKDMSENERTLQTIEWDVDGRPVVPDKPIISFIEGDGIGPDIWAAARPVFDAAVRKAYGEKRRIIWHELLAGEKAQELHGSDTRLPQRTLEDIALYGIGIKGPLATPIGSGFRSLNVALRQKLDLYACVRPVHYFQDVPAPVVHP
ncbi:MAG: hypothetical protein B1H12_00170, partial [Desulfobacteraceae bacterium 4484_190.2]